MMESRRGPGTLRNELAAVLARGYLRLTQKPRNDAVSGPEKRLDLRAGESPDVVHESPQRRPS